MKKVEKHRTDKRRRTRMTVRAFCKCDTPYGCLNFCQDDVEFYALMDCMHPLLTGMSNDGY